MTQLARFSVQNDIKESGWGWLHALPGLLLGLLAFAVYCSTLSVGPHPGLSARLIAEQSGLVPKFTPDHPLLGAMMWAIDRIPVGVLSSRLNLFSALCGGLSVWLMYHLVARAVWLVIDVDENNAGRAGIAACLAGIGAALFLAFCRPFWTVANRASTGSFDVFLLLAVISLYLAYVLRERTWIAMLFAFLYGLGVVEYVAFIPLAPLFGFHLMYLLWRQHRPQGRVLTRLIVCALLGLSLYFLSAWRFHGTDGYRLRGYGNYWQILWYTWRDQYWGITRSLPKTGWLIIIMVTVVPWITCLAVVHRALNDEKDWSYYLLHAVMTGLVLSVLFEAGWLTELFGKRRVPLTPYVLTASVFGYLIAYWFLLPFGWVQRRTVRRVPPALRWLGLALVIPGLAIMCVLPFRVVTRADARSASFVNFHARKVSGAWPADHGW